mgnify:CR=1 FL=1
MPSIPYEPKPIGGLQVAGGASGYWAFEIPSRCLIYKLIVDQTAGNQDAFIVELYSSENAVQGQSESDSVGNEKGDLPARLFKVGPAMSGNGGYMEYFTDRDGNGFGLPFFSHDKHRLGNSRKIWLKISPQGSGQKEFAASIGVMTLE